MPILNIPSDAFSHGQIKSKLWLCEHFKKWAEIHFKQESGYTLNWYGSWIGLGPLLLLSFNNNVFKKINLFDLNEYDLKSSASVLDFWRCESIEVNTFNSDVNTITPSKDANQLFVNTACEHIAGSAWLKNIPVGSYVLLQSTDMPHIEHINCPENAKDFLSKYIEEIQILDTQELAFQYPDKSFKRFMLLGIKK
ncbi:hypothetical protein K2P97_03275 [bacterium]|nr:hypothetical protein [bacterium]